jgi:hypothetical protein
MVFYYVLVDYFYFYYLFKWSGPTSIEFIESSISPSSIEKLSFIKVFFFYSWSSNLFDS